MRLRGTQSMLLAGQLVSAQRLQSPHKGDDNISLNNSENVLDAQTPQLDAKVPTAREIAAARAARIRLGYEQGDAAIDDAVVWFLVSLFVWLLTRCAFCVGCVKQLMFCRQQHQSCQMVQSPRPHSMSITCLYKELSRATMSRDA